jgi:hypothetical protein
MRGNASVFEMPEPPFNPETLVSVSGTLGPKVTGSFDFGICQGSIFCGASSAFVIATTAAEPSALEGLLTGAGLLGLVEMARRKLKLAT